MRKWQNQISAHLDKILELQRQLLFTVSPGFARCRLGCLDAHNPPCSSLFPTPALSFLECQDTPEPQNGALEMLWNRNWQSFPFELPSWRRGLSRGVRRGEEVQERWMQCVSWCHDSATKVPPTVRPPLEWQADGGPMGKRTGTEAALGRARRSQQPPGWQLMRLCQAGTAIREPGAPPAGRWATAWLLNLLPTGNLAFEPSRFWHVA